MPGTSDIIEDENVKVCQTEVPFFTTVWWRGFPRNSYQHQHVNWTSITFVGLDAEQDIKQLTRPSYGMQTMFSLVHSYYHFVAKGLSYASANAIQNYSLAVC